MSDRLSHKKSRSITAYKVERLGFAVTTNKMLASFVVVLGLLGLGTGTTYDG
jgi:hypothetical protein